MSERVALVVEREAVIALAVEDLLTGLGFRVVLAHTSAEVEQIAASHLTVAIVNLRLGADLVGRQIIGRLRQQVANLPVVVVTAYPGTVPEADLRGLGGPTSRLQMPVGYDDLIAAIQDTIHRRQSGAVQPGNRRQADRTASLGQPLQHKFALML